MSENYIVFIEQPIKLDLMKYMWYKIQGKSFHRIMSWEPQYETVFHLVNRHTGEVGRVPLMRVYSTYALMCMQKRWAEIKANLFWCVLHS